MLNKLLEKLNGQSADATALARALVELGDEESAGRRGLADVQERRRQALLDDADDRTLDQLERQLSRAEARILKCELSAPLLRERLAAARAAAHKQAVARQFEKITTLYEKRVRPAVLEAEGAMLELLQARHAAGAEVGEHAVNSEIPIFAFAGFLGRGFAVLWVQEQDAALSGARAARAGDRARTAAAAPKLHTPEDFAKAGRQIAHGIRPRLPHEPSRMTDSQRQVSLALPTGPTSRGAPAPNDVGPLLEGHVRVMALRSGYTDYQGIQHHAGHIFQLRREYVEVPAKAGAVEICEESAAPATAVSGGASLTAAP